MDKLRRIRGRLKQVATEGDLVIVGDTTQDVLMEINKLLMSSSSSSVLHSASFSDLHSLVELTLKVADDFQVEEKHVSLCQNVIGFLISS